MIYEVRTETNPNGSIRNSMPQNQQTITVNQQKLDRKIVGLEGSISTHMTNWEKTMEKVVNTLGKFMRKMHGRSSCRSLSTPSPTPPPSHTSVPKHQGSSHSADIFDHDRGKNILQEQPEGEESWFDLPSARHMQYASFQGLSSIKMMSIVLRHINGKEIIRRILCLLRLL